MVILSILNGSGDEEVTWNRDNPEEVERARKRVAELKVEGYVFFLVDGTVADEVTAGGGKLIAKKLTAEEVVELESPPSSPEKKGARKTKRAVAVRPLSGGQF